MCEGLTGRLVIGVRESGFGQGPGAKSAKIEIPVRKLLESPRAGSYTEG